MAVRKKIIMKFGGTSVKDSASILNVIRIVKKEKASKIVVVSAISNGTNSLEAISRLAADKKVKDAKSILNELIKRHNEIINNLVDRKYKAQAIDKINGYKDKIEELIGGLSIINELTLRILDSFRVFGELMSSTVIYYAMRSSEIDLAVLATKTECRQKIFLYQL